jgi:hypothetical protein
MIIYPLPAQELDDKTLDKQIKAIAQVLCNVHHMKDTKDIPLQLHKTVKTNDVLNWLLECLANYLKLIDMGLACCEEWEYRFNDIKIKGGTHYVLDNDPDKKKIKYNRHKLQPVVEWARDNMPDLPKYQHTKIAENNNVSWLYNEEQATPFPLVMPEKYRKLPMESAPTDKPFIGIYGEDEYLIQWAEERKCMLAGIGGGNGFFGAGWEDVENRLIVDEPDYWRPTETIESYRNYYLCENTKLPHKVKVPKIPEWTRREKPNWLK